MLLAEALKACLSPCSPATLSCPQVLSRSLDAGDRQPLCPTRYPSSGVPRNQLRLSPMLPPSHFLSRYIL